MSKFSRSALGGLLFAFWLMCFVFPYSLFMAYLDHTPIGTVLSQMLVDFFVLWFFCGAISHCVVGMFDDINNRPRYDESETDQGDDKTDKNRSYKTDNNSGQSNSGQKNETDKKNGDSQ